MDIIYFLISRVIRLKSCCKETEKQWWTKIFVLPLHRSATFFFSKLFFPSTDRVESKYENEKVSGCSRDKV
ncbi:hypothetical protein [Oxalicibacterium solurbis]|uniref:hypothetical protein n=1 Tax=Oxalicibacterium solurbis TaxID=69280 RepID=UPI00166AC290|nr:hypothetical protein [Oxalicibacterium solurbis]